MNLLRPSSFFVVVLCACSGTNPAAPPGPSPSTEPTPFVAGDEPTLTAAKSVATAYCRRLFSDCASVCTGVGAAFCPSSEQACVTETAQRDVDRYGFPVVSQGLADGCAAQLKSTSCSDLSPDSVECDTWLAKGCANDADGFGTPYSPLTAAPLPLGLAGFAPTLCEHVVEYFSVQLKANEGVALDWAPSDAGIAGRPSLRVKLHRLKSDALGRTVMVEIDDAKPSGWPHTYRAPFEGKYVLAFDAWSEGTSRPEVVATLAAQ